jgi:hypothetical protein
MSYRGSLYFGLIACRELVPDLDVMAGFLREELDDLTAAAGRQASGTRPGGRMIPT